VLAKKLRLQALSKQNRILQLRQALAQKAAETSRLYIALLLLVIILISVWLHRLKQSHVHLRRMVRHDSLTGAFTRQHFFGEAERVLLRLQKSHTNACMALLDLDHFKEVNDTYGHAAGDEALKHTVAICRRELRASDVFGRIGGEEFGILMPECSREQGGAVANRIRHAIATTPVELDPQAIITISASFGLACSGTSGYVLKQLCADADAALYRAKRSGRNRLIVNAGKEVSANTSA
jgi:diguanylate cyclase (GGDEF)-like protein